jgi:hypothetical protein
MTTTDILPACVADCTWTLREFRRAARVAAGLNPRNTRPVRVVAGDVAPHWDGSTWCYTTVGGTRIRHPSAYSRKGWSNMIYCPSTLEIVVGADWRPTVGR